MISLHGSRVKTIASTAVFCTSEILWESNRLQLLLLKAVHPVVNILSSILKAAFKTNRHQSESDHQARMNLMSRGLDVKHEP